MAAPTPYKKKPNLYHKKAVQQPVSFWGRLLGLLIFVFFTVLTAGGAWFYSWTQSEQPNPPSHSVLIAPGGVNSVAAQLVQQGAIDSAPLFILLARISGQDASIKAGSYALKAPMSPWQILKKLAKGEVDLQMFSMIEGWNWRDLRRALNAHPSLKHDTAAMSDSEILAALGISATSPEGLFFPDSYHIDQGSSDLKLLARAHRLMQEKLDAAWANRQADLPLKSAYDALILASIVEKETGKATDRPMVSGVFVNRLRKGMRLQTDPTVIYGVGEAFKGDITKAHLRMDTAYNTYTRAGLPPTPIAMVGEAALIAATQPSQTKAFYFVAKGDGYSAFSESLEQHNAAVRKYLSNR
ncbi:endolytic transglycosylase MltG [uncultured Deefgea sp.]|uniref:endolytic transglycosylase MltG n=1 Tax=uncultured Deefgea sp. TaxID=1304914 RepID=UPI0025920C73|nr:endolytic transglycosylase MltG [uncultured Deefgea sp.]